MSQKSTGIAGGAVAVLGAAVVLIGHSAGWLSHGAEATFVTAKNAHEAQGLLRSLDEGTYVERQAKGLFCSAATSLNLTGSLPDQAGDWRSFVKARVGYTSSSEDYFSGKLQQLETAADLAQRNPQAARRYYEACRPLSP